MAKLGFLNPSKLSVPVAVLAAWFCLGSSLSRLAHGAVTEEAWCTPSGRFQPQPALPLFVAAALLRRPRPTIRVVLPKRVWLGYSTHLPEVCDSRKSNPGSTQANTREIVRQQCEHDRSRESSAGQKFIYSRQG